MGKAIENYERLLDLWKYADHSIPEDGEGKKAKRFRITR